MAPYSLRHARVCANLTSFSGRLVFFSMLVALGACANGICHQIKHPELAAAAGVSTAANASCGSEGCDQAAASPGERVGGQEKTKTVLVFKPDGSLQCNRGHSILVDEMERQLSGIRVFSRHRQSDGRMHAQVCGSPTGFINVYEISEASLSQALARGFKKL